MTETRAEYVTELDRLRAELNQATAAGYKAATMASNALNREAELTARLAEAESVAAAQGEIITRMSEQHAKEVARWQTLCLRQAEAISWLYKVLPFPREQDRARRLFADLLGERE